MVYAPHTRIVYGNLCAIKALVMTHIPCLLVALLILMSQLLIALPCYQHAELAACQIVDGFEVDSKH